MIKQFKKKYGFWRKEFITTIIFLDVLLLDNDKNDFIPFSIINKK